MGNKISQPSGYSIKDVENQEMTRVTLEEEKPLDAIIITSSSSSSSTNSGYIFLEHFQIGAIAAQFNHLFFLFTHGLLLKPLPPNPFKWLPGVLLVEATLTSMRFGSFETLKRKVEAGNCNRMPLNLYQEACCALTSGAVTAFVAVPMLLAEARVKVDGNRLSLLQDLYRKCENEGVLAIWKGGWHRANFVVLVTIGMLTPYNRCFNYFRESLGSSEDGSILGASLVSGFVASACSMPYAMKYMKPDANGNRAYYSSLDCAMKILKSRGGPLALFTGSHMFFYRVTGPILMYWFWRKELREWEEKIHAIYARRSSAIVGGRNEIVNNGFSDTAEE